MRTSTASYLSGNTEDSTSLRLCTGICSIAKASHLKILSVQTCSLLCSLINIVSAPLQLHGWFPSCCTITIAQASGSFSMCNADVGSTDATACHRKSMWLQLTDDWLSPCDTSLHHNPVSSDRCSLQLPLCLLCSCLLSALHDTSLGHLSQKARCIICQSLIDVMSHRAVSLFDMLRIHVYAHMHTQHTTK